MVEPEPAPPEKPVVDQRRRIRRLALVALPAALLGGVWLYIRTSGPALPRTSEGPLRFTMQAEPPTLPPIAFNDGSGQEVTLQAFRGKVVLLNIWATWCAPCRTEMPSLDRLQQRLSGRDFEVVALSIDKGENAPNAIRAFYKTIGVSRLPVYVDAKGEASTELRVVGVPATILIDRQGREIGRLNGIAEWDSAEAIALIRKQIDKRS